MSAKLLGCSALLFGTLASWTQFVNERVTEPYLDEFFHVPQAQQYCAGHFKAWDPKITTPPGLYLIASSLSRLVGCSTAVLRIENAICLFILFLSLYGLQLGPKRTREQASRARDIEARRNTALTAMNIVLFPPLFFFSALYYTDIPSTLSVVLFMRFQMSGTSMQLGHLMHGFCLYAIGICALFFRQTNIFWIAIFPAATDLVQLIDQGQPVVRQSMYTRASGFGDSWNSVVRTSWKMRVVYDPPVAGASFEDYLRCIVTIILCCVRTLTDMQSTSKLLIELAPFYGLLGAFATFVLLNGSVVLGDKSNHVATVHLPQMLYIWPYFVFFSWPLLLPQVASVINRLFTAISSPSPARVNERSVLPRLRYVLVFCLIAAATVRYNTIIHPFTLADNRHYTFYVFRLLMRPWWMRYAVIPLYAFGAWLCIQTLASGNHKMIKGAAKGSQVQASSPNETKLSFVIVWLITTSLQLITAPLVEPRYLILPWLVWRLNVPKSTQEQHNAQKEDMKQLHTTRLGQLVLLLQSRRVMIETVWYMLINAVTGYIFLYWGFTWLSEPGKTQRFMW